MLTNLSALCGCTGKPRRVQLQEYSNMPASQVPTVQGRWRSSARAARWISMLLSLTVLALSASPPGEGGDVLAAPSRALKFATLPPGSTLPTDAECASRVRRNPWEPRADNATANNTNEYGLGNRLTGSYLAQYGYE